MGLSDIAAGVEVVDKQRDRGVATVDRTADSLAERLADYEDEIPCDARAAATLVEAYTEGKSVGDAARAAGLAPTDGAKALHLFGESVSPVGPIGREVVRDWIAGRIGRTEALDLAGVSNREFALAAYVETHDPVEGARDAVEGTLAPETDAAVDKRDALDGTMNGVGELR